MNKRGLTINQCTRRIFDRVADNYDDHAVLQDEVANRMNERLSNVHLQPSVILDVGCATGYSSSLLHSRYPQAKICSLDFSEKMLQVLHSKHKLDSSSLQDNLSIVCADLIKLPFPDKSVDLLWANMVLHWISNINQAFNEFNRVLKTDGLLMFSTLGIDTLHELTNSFVKSKITPRVNTFFDMHNLGDALLDIGFKNPVMDMETIILTYKTLDDLLHDLKLSGSHCIKHTSKHSIGGKQRMSALRVCYESWRKNGVLPATYEIIYGHAWGETSDANYIQNNKQTIRIYSDSIKG